MIGSVRKTLFDLMICLVKDFIGNIQERQVLKQKKSGTTFSLLTTSQL